MAKVKIQIKGLKLQERGSDDSIEAFNHYNDAKPAADIVIRVTQCGRASCIRLSNKDAREFARKLRRFAIQLDEENPDAQ